MQADSTAKYLTFVIDANANIAMHTSLGDWLASNGVSHHTTTEAETWATHPALKAAIARAGGPPCIVVQDKTGHIIGQAKLESAEIPSTITKGITLYLVSSFPPSIMTCLPQTPLPEALAIGQVEISPGIDQNKRGPIRRENDARDKWIYEQCCKGIAYGTIALRLPQKNKRWQRISSKQGIQQAARKYADRHKLPPPPSRQNY